MSIGKQGTSVNNGNKPTRWKLNVGLPVLAMATFACAVLACAIPADAPTPDIEAMVRAQVERELASMPTEPPPTLVSMPRPTVWDHTANWHRSNDLERIIDDAVASIMPAMV